MRSERGGSGGRLGARLCWTVVALLFAAGGFFGAAPMPASPLNPFGIVFLFLSGVVWLGWGIIQDAYSYDKEVARSARGGSDLMLLRLAPFLVKRRSRKPPSR